MKTQAACTNISAKATFIVHLEGFFRGESFAADSMVVACVAYVSFVKKKGKKNP